MLIVPYRTLGEVLKPELSVSGAELNSLGGAEWLVTRIDEETIDLALTFDAEPAIDSLFPEEERSDPPVQRIMKYQSTDACIRGCVPMRLNDSGSYEGSIRIDESQIDDFISLRAEILRAQRRDRVGDGFATERGCRLAWSATIDVRFREREPVAGHFLSVEWIDFSEAQGIPREYDDSVYYLDEAGIQPVLYLNSSVAGALIKLIDYKGNGTLKAYSRDAVFRSIAVAVWSNLGSHVLEDLISDANQVGGPVDLDDSLAPAWKASVIRQILPVLRPNSPANDLEEELCHRISESDYQTQLKERMHSAAQQFVDLRGKYEILADEIHRNV